MRDLLYSIPSHVTNYNEVDVSLFIISQILIITHLIDRQLIDNLGEQY